MMSKKPTKDTIDAWIDLHRAHRQLLERVESTLKSNGLPPLDWYDVLIELNREKLAGLRQYEIGEKILLNKHNLSRLIDRLEKNSLVGRHVCTEDGRGNLIRITEQGEQMLANMWRVYGQAMEENFGAKLDPADTVALSRILRKLLA